MPSTNDRGFTLIELMVAIAIIGILAAVAISAFATYQARAKDKAAETDLHNLVTQAAASGL